MSFSGQLIVARLQIARSQEWNNSAMAWRFARVREGTGYLLQPGRACGLTPGEVVVVAPGVKTVVRASKLADLVLHGFGFVPESLWGFFTLLERSFFEAIQCEKKLEVRVFPAAHRLSQAMEYELGVVEGQAPLAKRARLLALAADFFADPGVHQETSCGRSVTAQQRFEEIIARIPDTEMIHQSPQQLAQLCGCSGRHFSRLFRERFGQSPRARQADMRLLKACQLLASTTAKITDVALESGYRSLSLFNSRFRRRYSMSPSEWRQKMGERRPASGRGDAGPANTFRPSDPAA